MNNKLSKYISNKLIRYEYKLSKHISRDWFERVRFRQATGRRINYKNPVFLNDKLFWLNKYWQPNIKIILADKLLMRDYVKRKGLEKILIPLIGVWNNSKKLNLDELPNSFVLKTNHACGFNIICRDKKIVDFEEVKLKLDNWLKIDYGKIHNEFHYSKIKPLIIAEKFIGEANNSIVDYKLHCINGEPFCFMICRDRTKNDVKLSSYSLEWERLAYLKNEDPESIIKPDCLKDILDYSKILSKGLPYVRLDYYIIKKKIYLGEFTFTPYGNTVSYYKDEALKKMGDLLELPEINK